MIYGRDTYRRTLVPFACLASLILIAAAQAEPIREGSVQIGVTGKLMPKSLPRHGKVPVALSFSGRIQGTDQGAPPQLRSISIEINRNGDLTTAGIPNCRIGRIDPSTTEEALLLCSRSLVGTGTFSANIKIPEQSPFPSRGRLLAFNGRYEGRPAVLAQIYGNQPAPTSYVLPFIITRTGGTYGIKLEASLPQVTGDWGFVTGLSLTLDRRFRWHGKSHSYLAADCPAPPGFPGAVFPLARTSFGFEGGQQLTSVLTRSCTVRQ
jgi:hypothetical protein